ncbi:hypothetical protein JOC94_004399 [Bacillus thermophilus]|uniref:Uncharacterized protein n=1 Tax=Siminovitchia thermophila TaxID=1245522 RepID=A0ABS2RCH9_9BACI|nr:hypothetical protein [Siminovitchia thermophila]MBM7717371.1 hypothetical protein [Siminovitchia thermophila]
MQAKKDGLLLDSNYQVSKKAADDRAHDRYLSPIPPVKSSPCLEGKNGEHNTL